MSDSTCFDCYGSGFDKAGRICINHLGEAYSVAIKNKDLEMAAVIIMKQRELTAQRHK